MPLERIYSLAYEVHLDGSIDLEQDCGAGNVDRVALHPCHVRHLFQEAGHLLPPEPADELSKRLARQMCQVRLELGGAYGLSPGINEAITMLQAFCDSIPDSAFPFDLYETEAPELIARNPDLDRPEFQLTPPPKEAT